MFLIILLALQNVFDLNLNISQMELVKTNEMVEWQN